MSAVPASAASDAGPGRPFPWQFTTPLFIGSALNPVNSSPIAQPTAGKAAEVFGPRRVFLAGIVLVGVGGLAGGFAQDLITLLASRVLIGLGTSCAYPTAMLLIRRRARDAVLDKPPGGVLGGLQIAGIATASLGLPVGGVLVGTLGWRSVFFVVVITLVFGLVTGFASAGNQTALYSQASADQLGTASGLLRTFGYVGSIASSAITGMVFRTSVSDSGVHLIAWIMIGVSVALVLISLLDRALPARTSS